MELKRHMEARDHARFTFEALMWFHSDREEALRFHEKWLRMAIKNKDLPTKKRRYARYLLKMLKGGIQ